MVIKKMSEMVDIKEPELSPTNNNEEDGVDNAEFDIDNNVEVISSQENLFLSTWSLSLPIES